MTSTDKTNDNVLSMDMEPGEGKLSRAEKQALRAAGINPADLDPMDVAAVIAFMEEHWNDLQALPSGPEMLHRFGALPAALSGGQVQNATGESEDERERRKAIRHAEQEAAKARALAYDETQLEEMRRRDSQTPSLATEALAATILAGTAAVAGEVAFAEMPMYAAREAALYRVVKPSMDTLGHPVIAGVGGGNEAVTAALAENVRSQREAEAKASTAVAHGKSDTL